MNCYGAGVGMMFLWALFLVAIVVGAILLVRALWSRAPNRPGPVPGSPPGGSALGILEERYARGEIDHQEFEERRRYLVSGQDPGG